MKEGDKKNMEVDYCEELVHVRTLGSVSTAHEESIKKERNAFSGAQKRVAYGIYRLV